MGSISHSGIELLEGPVGEDLHWTTVVGVVEKLLAGRVKLGDLARAHETTGGFVTIVLTLGLRQDIVDLVC